MKLIRLILVLLTIVAGCLARSVSVTSTEKPAVSTEKSTTSVSTEKPTTPIESSTKSTIGLTSSTTPPQTKTVLPAAKANPLFRPRPATANQPTNKADALYQVASNLLQKEKNWLQTEKWLIDNVYRLRNELTDIKRELSDQKKLNSFLSQRASNSQLPSGQLASFPAKGATLLQDLNSLRADHQLIAQQQQQLIQSNKDQHQQLNNQSNMLTQLTSMMKEHLSSMAPISQAMVSVQQVNDSANANQLIGKLMYELKRK